MRSVYGPVFFFGFIGVALLAVTHGWNPAWLSPLLLMAIGVSTLCERRWPYREQWNRSHGDDARDVVHAGVNETLNVMAVAAIPLIAMIFPDAGLWPADWPLALQLLLAVTVADLGITLVHYASHRWPLFWRLHAVHHSVARLYGFNGLMKHPVHQFLETLGGTLPLLMCGLPQPVAALLAFSISIELLLQHSNVGMRIGALRYVFAWAPVHRLHHLKYGTHGDVNFALFFPIWDRLLGTALHLPRYRLADDDVGIGDCPDYPVGWFAQLRQPFVRQQKIVPPPALPGPLREALAKHPQA
ncbi:MULTISPECIES: sterol desaturase family protein [unclassified Pseudomonas]|uniref:sterol desaturase family protein n=1 Tax=unclassified Pseudomonas TaxID=196821 RepID=UPI0025CF3896|nr:MULTISPECIES: sterol desaturase family protein [unclassified Pseudomonas]